MLVKDRVMVQFKRSKICMTKSFGNIKCEDAFPSRRSENIKMNMMSSKQ